MGDGYHHKWPRVVKVKSLHSFNQIECKVKFYIPDLFSFWSLSCAEINVLLAYNVFPAYPNTL